MPKVRGIAHGGLPGVVGTDENTEAARNRYLKLRATLARKPRTVSLLRYTDRIFLTTASRV